MYVKSISVENLRCFAKASAALQYPGRTAASAPNPNVNLLLGNNGAGKTTTLKALALASLAPAFARSSGFLTYNLVRNGTNLAKPEAELVLHPQDSPAGAQGLVPRCGVECRDRKLGESEAQPSPVFDGPPHERMFESETPAFFVVGYGATRRVEESSSYNPADQLKRRGLW